MRCDGRLFRELNELRDYQTRLRMQIRIGAAAGGGASPAARPTAEGQPPGSAATGSQRCITLPNRQDLGSTRGVPETMQAQEKPAPGARRSPWLWLIGVVALTLYVTTLNRWVRLESLPVVAKVTGWDWTPTLFAPLHYLLTFPFRALPAAVQPVALNLLAAVLAALTLVLLARSIALLPFDRTLETRQRERGPHGRLSIPAAWLPPVLAVVLCGLQLTFWEHATAATGEMLDLVLFAYVVRGLLEYRVDPRESWLTRCALVYGLAITNNYAMIAFFPAFLIALVWIRGAAFFRLPFLGRMALWGAAGLALYLLLPLVAVATGETTQGFWKTLRMLLGNQRLALASVPPYIVLLLSFTSLLPVFLAGIRWPSSLGDTSAAGAALTTWITRALHVVLLAGCASVFFDPRWSPRELGLGLALLPFYYLAAIGVGYYSGYLLLLGRAPVNRFASRNPGTARPTGNALAAVASVATLVAAGFLAAQNLPAVRQKDGRGLAQLAERVAASLPTDGGYVVSDSDLDLLLAEAGLHRRTGSHPHVLVTSRLLQFRLYHEQLARHYPGRWPLLPNAELLPEPIDTAVLAQHMAELARSNRLYYLHPSMGFFFEQLQLTPHGLAYELRLRPTDSFQNLELDPTDLEWNRRFWKDVEPLLAKVEPADPDAPPDAQFIARHYSRALNYWAVTLQRHASPKEATPWLEHAVRLNPDNFAARENLKFNAQLLAGTVAETDLKSAVEVKQERRSWDELVLQDGPFDTPYWSFRLGQIYSQGQLFRQALTEFQRACELLPNNAEAQMWRQNMEAMTRMARGEVAAAEAQVLALRQQYPREDAVGEALTQIYLTTGRMTNALASVHQQLALNPSNRVALLNQAFININLKDYAAAIPALDTLLALVPDSSPALMNRAIAHLQLNQLDQAQRDYEALRRLMPRYHAVYFGLGEIAYRRQDTAAALEHYELYLEHGRPGTEEYRSVEQRVQQLRGGDQRR